MTPDCHTNDLTGLGKHSGCQVFQGSWEQSIAEYCEDDAAWGNSPMGCIRLSFIFLDLLSMALFYCLNSFRFEITLGFPTFKTCPYNSLIVSLLPEHTTPVFCYGQQRM